VTSNEQQETRNEKHFLIQQLSDRVPGTGNRVPIFFLMIKYYCVNSEIIPVADAKLQVNDLGLLRAYGVFDFFRVREGVPVFVEDHLVRFEQSADFLGLDLPVSKEALTKQILQLIEANGVDDSSIRLVLTGGYSSDGYSPSDQANLIILQHPFKAYDPKLYTDGVKLITLKYTRDTPMTKTTNYLVPIRMIKEIKDAGAFDVLYHNGKHVSESSRSNIFIVDEDGNISTPKVDALEGITRKKTIELAKQHFNLTERDITLEEVLNATECFITSTTKGTLAIVDIEGKKIGNGKPGAVTKALGEHLESNKLNYIAQRKVKTP